MIIDSTKKPSQYQIYINGQWTTSTNQEVIEVENPANEEVVATVPAGSKDDAQRALEAAQAAQPAWEALPAIERAKLIIRLAELVDTDRDNLAHLIVSEQGNPLDQAYGEVDATIQFLKYSA